jgi:L-fucose isomerase-like protein
MRFARGQGQLEALIFSAREELAKRVKDAEARGEIPDEATIMVETKAIVVIGGKIKRTTAAKNWINQMQQKLPPDQRQALKNEGGAHLAARIEDGVVGHLIFEVVDVHMSADAAKRLAEGSTGNKEGDPQ